MDAVVIFIVLILAAIGVFLIAVNFVDWYEGDKRG